MATTTDTVKDERLVESGFFKKFFSRPELGALAGCILVWIIFAIAAPDAWLSLRGTASYLEVSSQIGILAVAVALLMIGGEFDLSIGSIVGFTGVIMAIIASEFGLPFWLGALIALGVALLIGFVNGFLVVWTKLPSFIITLGGLFVFRGLTIVITRALTGRTQIGGLDDLPGYALLKTVFGTDISIFGTNFAISILWWILFTIIATYVLLRTPVGNWIFGTGGAAESARNVGVPVDRLKTALFMLTAFAAWTLATVQLSVVKSADTKRGEGQEFVAIIAAVIGGNLLTGGYGSAVGAALGALFFGMVRQGLVFAGVDADWFQVFVGLMLIIAVLVNNYIRKRAEEARR
ncbi:MAG: ABC transporter permease [Anaerolineaceae bacterium]|nr:MAG: ABC transporter permease [Anaerolineaceae bacterium]